VDHQLLQMRNILLILILILILILLKDIISIIFLEEEDSRLYFMQLRRRSMPMPILNSKRNVALKKVSLLSDNLSIFNELDSFQAIGHDNPEREFIVKLHSVFVHKSSCYLVLDCLSGDFRQFLQQNRPTISQQSVVYVVACIGSALSYIHLKGVIHRDIKPENIG